MLLNTRIQRKHKKVKVMNQQCSLLIYLFASTFLLVTNALGAVAHPNTQDRFDSILKSTGFSADEISQVEQGQLIRKVLPSSNEREIGMAFAFTTKAKPEDIKKYFLTLQLKKKIDPSVNDFSLISHESPQSDIEKLKLGPNGEGLAKEFSAATPDGSLNLSEEEIAAFKDISSNDNQGSMTTKAETVFRNILLERFHSYKKNGLAGILPYARAKSKSYKPGEDLLKSLQFSKILESEAPSFHSALVNYPKKNPDGLEESFAWISYEADGETNFLLSHRAGLLENDSYVFSERQFFNLRGYNCLQGFGGAFSCGEKGTAVVFASRTSTDQVTGWGGGAKRAIGVRMMGSIVASQLERFREEESKGSNE